MDKFTNLFSLSKTLRFELKPIGKTLKFIKEHGIIQEDEIRANDYASVKTIINEYHKFFIDKVLSMVVLDNNLLTDYFECFCSSNQNELISIQKKLRECISKSFSSQKEYKDLFKKELITKILPKFEKEETNIELINKFNQFTTYFVGFNENRENIYDGKGKKGSIAHRLIDENLNKFIQDIIRFKKIESNISDELLQLNNNFGNDIKKQWGIGNIVDIFNISFYNNLLTQKNIDLFNTILGAKVEEDNHIKGLNQYINLYNQQNKTKLPILDVLYKQILTDRDSLSWLPEKFETDNEAIKALNDFCEILFNKDLISQLKQLLNYISEFELEHIYVSSQSITKLSNHVYGNWSMLNIVLGNSKKNSFSIAEIDNAINDYNKSIDTEPIKTISEYFELLSHPFENLTNCYSNATEILHNEVANSIFDNENKTHKIKELCDSIMIIKHIIMLILGDGNETHKDGAFYGHLIPIADTLNAFTKLYDMVRNRATNKQYSTNKIKLNFNNPALLGGWDRNKEQDYLSVIFRKEGKYYLGIMTPKSKNVLKRKEIPNAGDCYEKMVYKQISLTTGIGGFIRKCFNAAQNLGWECPTNCLNSENKIIIKDDEVNNNLTELIDCQKNFFNTYEKDGIRYRDFYDYHFKNSSDYESLADFYRDVEQQSYKIIFQDISKTYIDDLVKEGKLYLFEIYNKDFSMKSRGTKNLHTLYWEALFSKENQKDVVYKLSGGAEIFYRKASIIPKVPTHKQGIPIKLRSDNTRTKTFEYDIQKDRRFTQDKFLFHVPISLNFKSTGKANVNNKVIEHIKANGVKHIIGIDRGERNLLYVTMIDLLGNIVEQFSLNEISNNIPSSHNSYIVNYHKQLTCLEKERDTERKNWDTLKKIADLKDGYMSHVIHKITTMMIKHSAIVVLEKLNKKFMNSRIKVERQVYQKFEQKLIDKLNYFVDKTASKNDLGYLYNALQLTPEVQISRVGTQCGFIFYIPSSYTSNIDPITGFINLFYTKYTNQKSAKQFFTKFEDIRISQDGNYEFIVNNYIQFNAKAKDTRQNWIISTQGERIEKVKDNNSLHWTSRTIILTKEFDKLFEHIDKTNLKASILAQNDAKFFKKLLHLFRLTVQLRNSDENNDYIISPVANKNKIYFDSRFCNESLPKDADANGAYNIARKGLILLNRCNNAIKDNNGKYSIDYFIALKDWLNYTQQDN